MILLKFFIDFSSSYKFPPLNYFLKFCLSHLSSTSKFPFSNLFCPISVDDTFILPVTSTQNVLVIFNSSLSYQTLVSSTESTLKKHFHWPYFHFHTHSRILSLHYLFTCNGYLTIKNLFTFTLKSTAELIFISHRLKTFPVISPYQIKSKRFSMSWKFPDNPCSLGLSFIPLLFNQNHLIATLCLCLLPLKKCLWPCCSFSICCQKNFKRS